MKVATDYVGPRPVIDLHAAGLKVGEELVRAMRKYENVSIAIKESLKNPCVMGWPDENHSI
jgi:hypothetical protein